MYVMSWKAGDPQIAEQPHAVVVGNIEVARRTCSELVEHGFVVTHLLHPTDSEMRAALTRVVGAVAILVRGDVTAPPSDPAMPARMRRVGIRCWPPSPCC
jgi:hypothetical protein